MKPPRRTRVCLYADVLKDVVDWPDEEAGLSGSDRPVPADVVPRR